MAIKYVLGVCDFPAAHWMNNTPYFLMLLWLPHTIVSISKEVCFFIEQVQIS